MPKRRRERKFHTAPQNRTQIRPKRHPEMKNPRERTRSIRGSVIEDPRNIADSTDTTNSHYPQTGTERGKGEQHNRKDPPPKKQHPRDEICLGAKSQEKDDDDDGCKAPSKTKRNETGERETEGEMERGRGRRRRGEQRCPWKAVASVTGRENL
ncbi:hypothetical protein EUGRSUZ_I02175 [Eucalyptus grandis]|uniref:Uncharacterized protein n=2 Tax=Eucalyptus grandis TaxID=71139 RepID=A0ACC3JHR2_EUCGR|nr:hypothetical protein EUGRSUZ_I02175 [Eucalyptus grandis]